MRKLFYFFVVCFACESALAQTYFNENFAVSGNDSLTSNGWTSFSGGTTNAIRANATGLTYTGYPNSGIGNAASMTTSGQDAYRDANGVPTSGSVYVSFLANFSAVQAAGDYFFGLLPNNNTSNYTARTFAKLHSSGYFKVAVTKATETPVYSADSFQLGTTYLFVLKYTFNTGSTNDDSIRLFVFSSGVPASEPATPTAAPVSPTANDGINVSRIALRQGTSSNAPTLTIDGIRFATAWANAPLPVEFTSVSATSSKNRNTITWSTASEKNNSHFEIERSVDGSSFSTIGIVKGSGNSNEARTYNFTDGMPAAGINYYRVRQVDFDGASGYSQVVTANKVAQLVLSSAPNPFNTELVLNVKADHAVNAAIGIYDMTGKLHHSETKALDAGDNSTAISTAAMPAGIYLVRISHDGEVTTQKIIKK